MWGIKRDAKADNADLEDDVDGGCLFRQDLQAEADPIGVIGRDRLRRKPGLAQMDDRGQDEHRLGGEAVDLLVGVLGSRVLDGLAVPQGQLRQGRGQRGAHEEVTVHQVLAKWWTFLEVPDKSLAAFKGTNP